MSRNPVPRRISGFHAALAGQVEVQVVVRQEDRIHTGVEVRVGVPKPANLRCRITRQNEIADFGDAGIATSERLDDAIAFGGCGRIAPELHRYEHFARSVDRNKAMLLTGNTHSDDAVAHAPVDACRGLSQRFNPPLGPLFGNAVIGLMEIQRCAADGRDPTRLEVVEDDFDALRPDVDTQNRGHDAPIHRSCAQV